MRRCENCGSPLDPDDRYCGECGHDHGEPAPIPGSSSDKKGRRFPRWLAVIGILIVLGCCVLAVGGYVVTRTLEGLELPDLEGLLDSNDPGFVPTVEFFDASTQLDAVWIEHNVEFEDQFYMVVHVEYEVLQQDTDLATVVAYFWLEDGSPMPAYEPEFDVGGQAAALDVGEVTFSPSTYWEDFQLWIPYSVLEVGEEHFATVELQDANTGRLLDSWESESFTVLP